MKVADAQHGQIIETLSFGTPTGAVYRIARNQPYLPKVVAYKQFTQDKVGLHPDTLCRVLDAAWVDGFPAASS